MDKFFFILFLRLNESRFFNDLKETLYITNFVVLQHDHLK